ncbi:phage tail protein [Peribacillus asahii]|uniref:phage tail-collar fiber domain-containing protein n=1 Tax=Peribacillus asahii TaxID=228899 RepID=UPI00381F3AF8
MESEALAGWLGKFEIQIMRGDQLEIVKFPNLITDAWLNTVRDATMSATPMDLQIKYIALGKDDGTILPLAPSNTRLGNEVERKVFTKIEKDGTGVVKRTVNINSAEGNFHIKEIGIFAGSVATSALNSGILVARVFYDRDKDELESINIVRTDIVGRL